MKYTWINREKYLSRRVHAEGEADGTGEASYEPFFPDETSLGP